jgi:hypothetical protein
MRKLALYITRQAHAEAHTQPYIQAWMQGGGWVDEGTQRRTSYLQWHGTAQHRTLLYK